VRTGMSKQSGNEWLASGLRTAPWTHLGNLGVRGGGGDAEDHARLAELALQGVRLHAGAYTRPLLSST